MLGQIEAQKLCQKVLARCGSDPAEVVVMAQDSALTRFANNIIHQNVAETNALITVRYHIGKRVGSVTTNRMDNAALDELVEQARQNASASPEDPNDLDLPEPAAYTPVPCFDENTAEMEPAERAKAVGIVCRLATEKKLNASGAFSTGAEEVVVANSRGVFAYHAASTADFQTVVMGSDSSGRAHLSNWRAADLPVEALGSAAIEKADRGRAPRKIEPGEYTIILDPSATQDLVDMLNFYGMGAQAVLEGRSWMNSRMGQKAMSETVNIWDDGNDLRGAPIPFDFEGVPKQRVDIVKDGVVMGPVYDRYVGQKMGKASTGHAMPPDFRNMGPLALNLFMAGGDSSVEEMIRSTEKGLYITRFWYTRLVHPTDCVVTGMTRDGVFMVENGQIAYPVKNLRFTQSYVEALAHVEAIGRETHLFVSEYGGISTRVPAIKLAKFNFTGSTV